MSEKPESDEFEEEDVEDVAPGSDDVDVDHIMRDVESARRRAPKGGEPAWRRLERVMEERRTAELMSDFDDYDIGRDGDGDGDDESEDEDDGSDDAARTHAVDAADPQDESTDDDFNEDTASAQDAPRRKRGTR